MSKAARTQPFVRPADVAGRAQVALPIFVRERVGLVCNELILLKQRCLMSTFRKSGVAVPSSKGKSIAVRLALLALFGPLLVSIAHSHALLPVPNTTTQLAGEQGAAPGGSGLPDHGKTDRNCPVCWAAALSGAAPLPAGLDFGTLRQHVLVDRPIAAVDYAA